MIGLMGYCSANSFSISAYMFNRLHLNCRKHCSTAKTAKKSFKTLTIVATENEADNRVYSAICVSHKRGETRVAFGTTRN